MRNYKRDSFDVEAYDLTPNGYLNISGIVTRTGVFKYDGEGELRPADEIFKPESLETMFAIPVTWEHPPDLVTPETVPMYQKGFVASRPEIEKYDDNRGVVKLTNIIIQDKNLIDEIVKNGTKQFSLGYSCDLEENAGKFDEDDYVRIQRNVVYNHLAVVKEARCGDICSIIKKEDSMAKEYKKDCACQSQKRQDEMPKEELKKEEALVEKAEHDKKDEGEEPAWTKRMFEQHDKMLSLLEKLAGGLPKEDKKDEDESKSEEKLEKSEEEDCYDSAEEKEEMKKDKRKDSVLEAISSFNFGKSEVAANTSSFSLSTYSRQNFIKSLSK